MGFMDLFRRRGKPAGSALATVTPGTSDEAPRVQMAWSITLDKHPNPLAKLNCTTTVAKDAWAALLERRGVTGVGVTEETCTLQTEPTNPSDPGAVMVLIEGERVGYLWRGAAHYLGLDDGVAVEVPIQWAWHVDDAKTRVEAWVWLAPGAPKWQWSPANLPPMTPAARRSAEHQARRDLVAEGVAEGGERAATLTAGMTEGVHYLELVEPIAELKRQGRNEEALTLCLAAIDGAEAESAREGWPPPPAYTRDAAIIYRKMRDYRGEIAIIDRYIAAVRAARPNEPVNLRRDLATRYERAKELLAASEAAHDAAAESRQGEP